jgi:hypothetical protein
MAEEFQEKWIIHTKAEEMSVNIIQMWPIVKNIHAQFNTDIIHLDFDLMGYLFDQNGKLIKEKANPLHPCWTSQTPFPVNSISNDDEILSIWDRIPKGSEKTIFTQRKDDVKAMIDLKNKNPLNTVLLACIYSKFSEKEKQENGESKKVTLYSEVCTMYMIRTIISQNPTVGGKREVEFLLTVEPTVIMK